ncbi:MAG: aminotransferase class I/II-fold pyridoxal phosphate-dependent enzyme [Planctomycetes bacterium]|nr:aminotransferase class I/II-fold pyridoxal phosphate-dependent enzyme [Planctomycetota bacterium]
MIARRMGKLDSSGIRKVFDLAREMENPVNLSIGQPHFDIPPEIKAAAIDSINQGLNHYTVTQGIPELREAVMAQVFPKGPPPGQGILITSGTSGGLLLAFLALIDPGDEVLIPDPYFVMYKHLVNLCDGKPVFVNTYPDFRLTAERIEPCITPKTKVLITNSPANPTGAVWTETEVDEIIDLTQRHDLLLISDEIYSVYTYDGPPVTAAGRCDRLLLLNGFSKSHAMTGWRLGFAIGPEEIIREMTKLQQFSFVCAPSFAQHAAIEALNLDTSNYVDEYRWKRDMIWDGLQDKYELQRPEGAFYAFPKVPCGTGQEFVAEAIKNNLLVIPGEVFSERDTHFRIAYAADNETIEQGIEILNAMV